VTLGDALRRETATFVSKFADERVVERLMAVQRHYDDGVDSHEAFGIPRD
jgi:hypothetical protein